ncbi:MAG TPA: PIN domain-containing protein [Verrucomicrobiae bacterium]
MTVFADTNWLEALYFEPDPSDKRALSRAAVVHRRMRRHSGPLVISHIVLLEARNVFSRVAQEPEPDEWRDLLSDFNGRLYVDPMNWDMLRQKTSSIFEKYSHRVTLGTFDAALIASALLAGARELLSFDERLKVIATLLGMDVFPPLSAEGKALHTRLRQ